MIKTLPLTPFVSKRIAVSLPKHMKYNGVQFVRKSPNRAIELDGTSIIRALRRITKK